MCKASHELHFRSSRARLQKAQLELKYFTAQDPSTGAWTGSVLVVSFGQNPPNLSVQHNGQFHSPQPFCLDAFQNFSFWRWQLDLRLLAEPSIAEYSIAAEWTTGQHTEKRHAFHLPSQTQCWHWGFHSCNGFSHGTPGNPFETI